MPFSLKNKSSKYLTYIAGLKVKARPLQIHVKLKETKQRINMTPKSHYNIQFTNRVLICYASTLINMMYTHNIHIKRILTIYRKSNDTKPQTDTKEILYSTYLTDEGRVHM